MATNGDRTHGYEAQGRLQELWLTATVGILTNLLNYLLAKLKPTMIHPVPLPYRNRITQQYGVENPMYTRTGVHLGCDFACPVDTPLSAPADGQIIVSSKSPQRGDYVQFKHGDYVLEMRHLSWRMPVGNYKAGEIIARSGNTGTLTTGPHVCCVVWNGKDGIGIINKNNWSTLTVDCN